MSIYLYSNILNLHIYISTTVYPPVAEGLGSVDYIVSVAMYEGFVRCTAAVQHAHALNVKVALLRFLGVPHSSHAPVAAMEGKIAELRRLI